MSKQQVLLHQMHINRAPTGWKVKTVGESCLIRNDLRRPISIEEREKIKGEYPYYGPTGILYYINEYLVEGRFALIGEDGDHFLKYNSKHQTLLVEGKFNVNNHAHLIEATKECSVDWFYHYFRHRNITAFLTRQGAGRYKLNKETLKRIPILLPPLSEQKAITDILSTWDRAIEKIERLIVDKEKQFNWLQHQLIINSTLNNITWQHCRICDIADRIQRKSNGIEYPILTISSAAGFVLQEEKYSRFMAGKSVEDYILLRRGEFAYNKGNSQRFQFGCIFKLNDYDEALVPHVYVCFKLHDEIDPVYLGHVFESDYLKHQLGALVKTGVRNNGLLNIRPEEFMSVTVPIPPLNNKNL